MFDCRIILCFLLVTVLSAVAFIRPVYAQTDRRVGGEEPSAGYYMTDKPVFRFVEEESFLREPIAENYPPDPTSDIVWSTGMSGVSDIQTAFNNARQTENSQLGISIPMLSLPSQGEWDILSDGEKALWLINRERIDRGIDPLHGLEENVTSVAQYYAQYLMDNDAWGHYEDGNSPWERLEANPAIDACHDFLSVAENLAVFWTSGSSIPLPIERSVFNWMYDDGSCCAWGHRHAILWYPYNDNSGTSCMEGFLGIGRASGPHDGWNFGEIIVMNVFDPCSQWDYGTPPAELPTVTTASIGGITESGAVSGGNVTSDGGSPVTERGVCWGTSQNPTTDSDKTIDGSGSGSFTSTISGLSPNTPYYVRAYATNSIGTAYGAQETFTSLKDECPDDPDKTAPGICGCGVPDSGDGDSDGVLDCVDLCNGADASGDTDADGDCNEIDPDDDGDGMPDAWENLYDGLDPLVDDAGENPDKDRLTNYEEFILGSDPSNPNDPYLQSMPWLPLLLDD